MEASYLFKTVWFWYFKLRWVCTAICIPTSRALNAEDPFVVIVDVTFEAVSFCDANIKNAAEYRTTLALKTKWITWDRIAYFGQNKNAEEGKVSGKKWRCNMRGESLFFDRMSHALQSVINLWSPFSSPLLFSSSPLLSLPELTAQLRAHQIWLVLMMACRMVPLSVQ